MAAPGLQGGGSGDDRKCKGPSALSGQNIQDLVVHMVLA